MIERVAEEIQQCMTYQKPDEGQLAAFELLRQKVVALGEEITLLCPDCSDRDEALRRLRDCRMWANSAIAHKGRY